MPVNVSTWEEPYWDGTEPAGYGRPAQREPMDRDKPISTGEFWLDVATRILSNPSGPNPGDKVLEIGCGFGFVVEDLVGLGVDAHGIDISSYAITEAQARRPDLASRFQVADARTDLTTLFSANEFDYSFSWDFLVCLEDAELLTFWDDMATITRNNGNQVHFTKNGEDPPEFYNIHTLQWYVDNRPSPRCLIINIRELL